jgi:hypothetical protein
MDSTAYGNKSCREPEELNMFSSWERDCTATEELDLYRSYGLGPVQLQRK